MASLEPVAGDDPAPEVRTDDPSGCPAFYAQAVSGLTNGASPLWMASKLAAIGQKPISVLVDITNFISVDLGRPLHVYDRAKLIGPLVARKAGAGEQVEALNGKTYTLDAGDDGDRRRHCGGSRYRRPSWAARIRASRRARPRC